MNLVYFSGASSNTHRFVEKMALAPSTTQRIPLSPRDSTVQTSEPYILLTPTYGGGGRNEVRDAVPKQVIKFLNNPENRKNIRGVIASGNINFGRTYGYAADVVSRKCNVPVLYKFEILGNEEDVNHVRKILTEIEDD